MKFLERLLIKTKGWNVGMEIFLISGDSSTEQIKGNLLWNNLTNLLVQRFEWDEMSGCDYKLNPVDIANSGDLFFESPSLHEDMKALYRRLAHHLYNFLTTL
jgi:DNA repair and recombination RAD54-like protein